MDKLSIKEAVREQYAQVALGTGAGRKGCCSGSSEGASCDPITTNLYEQSQIAEVPSEAAAVSLGCGNPTALA